MEILRVPPYNVQATVDVDNAATSYHVVVEDMTDHSVQSSYITSTSDSKVTFSLPSEYDGSYLVTVGGDEYEYDVVRPYSDPTSVPNVTSATDIAAYAKHEEIARAIIDSVIQEGFYYKKAYIDKPGLGTDYMPIWMDAKQVLQVKENNVIIYDHSTENALVLDFEITKDNSAIVMSYAGELNRNEGAPIVLPAGSSDFVGAGYNRWGTFKNGYDYEILVLAGYKRLPSDIVRAAELLIDDLACGRLDYWKSYVSGYDTDQFKLKFDSRVFEGTGNIIVDKILSKYSKSITTVGVL
jgi:hypothetical protein